MGSGSWTASSWATYTTTKGYSASSTVDSLYSRTSVKKTLSPKNVMREACDSDEHPNSTPIIIGLDVTGSMGHCLESVFKKLNDLISELYDRKPIEDPQIMFAAFGDTECDDYPLQVTQFESDIRIAEQLNDVYFERGGGGNDGESYSLPWYFAARHTKIDSWDKHKKKGFIFTIGDECCLPKISKEAIKEFIGDDVQDDISSEEILTELSRRYNVYHLIIHPVHYQPVKKEWTNLLGQNAIELKDESKIAETIVSILEMHAGKSLDEVVDSWDGTTGLMIKDALKNLKITDEGEVIIEF